MLQGFRSFIFHMPKNDRLRDDMTLNGRFSLNMGFIWIFVLSLIS